MQRKHVRLSLLKNPLAFSLVEISLVLVIIALMSVGATKGKQLLLTAKRVKAANMAHQIYGMEGMVLWYDTFKADSIDIEQRRWHNRLLNGMDVSLSANIEYMEVSSLKGKSYMPTLCLRGNSAAISIGDGYALDTYYTIVAVLATTTQTQAGAVIVNSEHHDLQLVKGSNQNTDRVIFPAGINSPQADNYFSSDSLFAMLVSNGRNFKYQLWSPAKSSTIVTSNRYSMQPLGKLFLNPDNCFLELIVFNRDLDDPEFTQLSRYLSEKYAF